jgi:sulfate transport system permease protein
MAGGGNLRIKNLSGSQRRINKGNVFIRSILIGITLIFFIIFLIMPLVLVFSEALKKGAEVYFDSLKEPAALSAIVLTLTVAAIVVPLNTVFGLFAAWLISKFNFKGKTILTTMLDLPFAVSPVIAGLIFVLLFGARTIAGDFLSNLGIKIIFSLPGIVLATIFVTFPFVARELIPLMQEQGKDDEEAALILGASGFKMFWKITLPNIKWALLYGIVLCNARAIGEFGAVSVVSGHIRGLTNTIPLHVEILYSEYNFTASFAVASLLVLIAFITLIVKNIIEYKYKKELSKQ